MIHINHLAELFVLDDLQWADLGSSNLLLHLGRRLQGCRVLILGAYRSAAVSGSGADELLDLLMRVFLEPTDCILSCPPTFGMYPFDAELNAARCIEVPRKADFSLDMPSIRKAVDEFKPKLLFIASPNNPDGSLIEPAVLDELLSLPLLVILDEAYIEFAGDDLGAYAAAPRADQLASTRRILLKTGHALQLSWYAPELQGGALCDGILGDQVPVELHRLVHIG